MIASGTGSTMSGEDAFKLSDTYGFPLDLTREILAERGMDVDEARFHELIAEQRKRAREARKDAGADAWKATGGAHGDLPATQFVGYETLCAEGSAARRCEGWLASRISFCRRAGRAGA
mgnify:CR=1 FL=1